MKNTLALLLLLTGTLAVSGQNRLDDQGRKTGPWKEEYPDGTTLYEATFHEGEPVGMMVRYYESGAVRAKMMFKAGSDRSYAELFYKKGKRAAEGLFVSKKKDSVWTYYSEFDGTVRMRENYSGGQLHGNVTSYYPAGGISEEVKYEQDSREGTWYRYYEDGSLRLKGHYKNHMLEGPYEVYFADSTIMMSGEYQDNNSTGIWSYYDETGALLYSLEYKDGQPVDHEKHLKLMQDTLWRQNDIQSPQPFQ